MFEKLVCTFDKVVATILGEGAVNDLIDMRQKAQGRW